MVKDTTQLLTYLRTIISAGSVTAAAKRLYISQPYLSRFVTENERQLGYHLLDRSRRPIALTSMGVQYVRALEQLNNQYNKLMHDLEKMADVTHLRLGIQSVDVNKCCTATTLSVPSSSFGKSNSIYRRNFQ